MGVAAIGMAALLMVREPAPWFALALVVSLPTRLCAIRVAAQNLAEVAAPDRLTVVDDQVLIQVRPDNSLTRTSASIPPADVVAVRVSQWQGGARAVWIAHRSGGFALTLVENAERAEMWTSYINARLPRVEADATPP